MVELYLAKVAVAGSNPVSRSNHSGFPLKQKETRLLFRRHSQVVRQRSAKPLSPVRIWMPPPLFFPLCFLKILFGSIICFQSMTSADSISVYLSEHCCYCFLRNKKAEFENSASDLLGCTDHSIVILFFFFSFCFFDLLVYFGSGLCRHGSRHHSRGFRV